MKKSIAEKLLLLLTLLAVVCLVGTAYAKEYNCHCREKRHTWISKSIAAGCPKCNSDNIICSEKSGDNTTDSKKALSPTANGSAGGDSNAVPAASPDYYSLVEKLKNEDVNIDFMALRLSYTKTQNYKPYGVDNSAKDAAFDALNKKNYAEAVRLAESILEKNYTDLYAHMLCITAYRYMGNPAKSNFHKEVLRGLLGSLYTSGDGTTPEQAIVVISVAEEYFFLQAKGLKMVNSSSMTANSNHYDKMDVEDKSTAEKMVIYFNVDIPFGWLTKSLQKK